MFKRKKVSNDIDKFYRFTESLEKLQAARHEAYKIGTDREGTLINLAILQLLEKSTGSTQEPSHE